MRLRKTMPAIAVAAGMFLFTGTASAQDFNGAQLQNFCESTRDKVKTTTCFAFIKGAVDTYLILARVGSVTKPVACLPASVSVDLLRRTYIAWARKNPTALNHSAADALMVSWRAGYPCGKR